MILSYHDRSDGGLITTLLECSFAGHVGIDIDFKKEVYRSALIQLRQAFCQEFSNG